MRGFLGLVSSLVVLAASSDTAAPTRQLLITDLDVSDAQTWAAAKVYSTAEERSYRVSVAASNAALIRENNARYPAEVGFLLAKNEFLDLSIEEFKGRYTGGSTRSNRLKVRSLRGNREQPEQAPRNLQSAVDWVTAGAVNPPQSMGSCSASYAQAAKGALEGAHKINKTSLLSLSTQELIDCTGEFGCAGCSGGAVDGALEYTTGVNGITTTALYPYTGVSNSCQRGTKTKATTNQEVIYLDTQSDTALVTELAKVPLAITYCASSTTLQFYSSGLISSAESCPACMSDAGLAVGYGESLGTGTNAGLYIKIRAHFGTSWGEGGYFRVKRGLAFNNGDGICGIYTAPMRARVLP